jgi:hypothetical protein
MKEGTAWHWSIKPVEAPDRLIGIISLMDEPDNNRGFWLVPEVVGAWIYNGSCEDSYRLLVRNPRKVGAPGMEGDHQRPISTHF